MFSHEKSKPLQEALDVLDPKKETKPAKCNCSNSIITSLSITKSEFCTLRKQPTITVADVSFFGSYVHLADETDCFFMLYHRRILAKNISSNKSQFWSKSSNKSFQMWKQLYIVK